MWVPRYFLHFRWTSCLGGLDSACIGFKASPRRMIMDTVDGCKILHHQKDGSTPINNGINHLSTGAGFATIHRMFLATCHEISFLHLNAGGLWVHGDGVGVAGRQAMPCNLSTQKRTNRVEDFVGRFCWVYVEFTLACSWMTFRPWATVQICRLGQSWNSLWISQGFPIDFPPQRDHHQPQEARRAVPYRRPGVVDWARRCRNTQTSLGLVATTDSWTARGMQWE